MHVTIKWKKKMLHWTKNCWDKPQIMHDFRITPYINNIMHTAIVQRKQKAVCKRTAKFIDKLKPCKYSLTNQELKKQIFSNLEHTNQTQEKIWDSSVGENLEFHWLMIGESLVS